MITTNSVSALKKPVGIYILAILFILAPIGNILISFAGSGISNWYEPSIFIAFIQTMPVWEWLWLGLLFLAGLLLFRPHKLSWSFAIATLILILCINLYRIFSIDTNSINPQYLKIFSVIALFCTLGVLVIAFYFRFPYLDRRANWIKNLERFDLQTEIKLNDIKALTESISTSGCKVNFTAPHNLSLALKPGDSVAIYFSELSSSEAVNCSIIEITTDTLRLEFLPQQEQFIVQLKRLIKSKASLL